MCNTYIPIPMKVEKILIENPDRSLRTYDLSFVNEEDKKKFVYMPGQFCEFSILGKGESPFGIAHGKLVSIREAKGTRYCDHWWRICLHNITLNDSLYA